MSRSTRFNFASFSCAQREFACGKRDREPCEFVRFVSVFWRLGFSLEVHSPRQLHSEMVLGLGGWRLLQQLGHKPEVCHLNEGHAAFEVALAATRAGNLFTTHTPVAAGFDRFSPPLMQLYLKWYAEERLHISFEDLMALGRANRDDSSEPFKMAYLAVRSAGAIKGVSRLHGAVSRSIFEPLFPRWPVEEIPIGSVTNGVHTASWDSISADRLWSEACGKDRWLGSDEGLADRIRAVPDKALWKLRTDNCEELVRFVRLRTERQRASFGASSEEIEEARVVFDPGALTLGFARRFASYKRPNLLLHDPERLAKILTNQKYPVQLVLAGKAHPADQAGKDMIREWIQFVRRHDIREHAIFLIDYDMLLAARIVEGVDVWINTPRRPWEASGTSGMKVLANGGVNLSELDGWWAEAYEPEVGWGLGDGHEHGDDPDWDAAEAAKLYDILENEVVKRFYDRDHEGLPRKWIAMMRESMARLTPAFSANRAVREYTEKYYIPAAAEYRQRQLSNGALGEEIARWHRAVVEHWPKLQFGELPTETDGDFHNFRTEVYLGELEPEMVLVELYAQARNGETNVTQAMTRGEAVAGADRGFIYDEQVLSNRPCGDFTPRVIPVFRGAHTPLEARQILWQR